MHIVSGFEYKTEIELVLKKLEQKGINKKQIVAIPLDKRNGKIRIFDTIHHSDGVSVVDLAFIFGMICMLLGVIYGYVVEWGPIFLGLVGLIGGFLFGLIVKYFYLRKNMIRKKASLIEVILIVRCNENQQESIEEILWEHDALAMGIKGR